MQPLSWQGSLSLLIGSARRKLKQLYLQKLAGLDLTPPQMSALLCLQESGELCLGQLAIHARTDEPTASRVVTRLVAAGWVRMKEDAVDRRRARIALTPSGRALARRLLPLAAEVEAELLAELSPAEQRALVAGLTRATVNVERASLRMDSENLKRRKVVR